MKQRWLSILFFCSLISNYTFTLPLSVYAKTKIKQTTAGDRKTLTPVKHIIIIIGENHSFDNVFAVYQPKNGETIQNLLAEGIVKGDGTLGPYAVLATQFKAYNTQAFESLPRLTNAYSTLPTPNTTYAPSIPWAVQNPNLYPDPGLEANDEPLLKLGGTRQAENMPDNRFPNNLPNGPFQITRYVKYSAYTGDPIHRFFQGWLQSNCRISNANPYNPSGCLHNLYTWVAIQTDIGSYEKQMTIPFPSELTNQGGVQMGFYNMERGDASYFRWLADHFSINDNYHQSIMGGSTSNAIAIGTGDELFYENKTGRASVPPMNEIGNPNSLKVSNNSYNQDNSMGVYVDCSNITKPGILPIRSYLESLLYNPRTKCSPNTYYLINNFNPGFHRDGTIDKTGLSIPPSTVRTIGDELSAHKVSWSYYGEGFHRGTSRTDYYCKICNPFQYSNSIMTTPLKNNIKGLKNFYQALHSNTLPDVSFVKPDSLLDGHPASSKLELFEGFVKKVVNGVKKSIYWKNTAIIITMDESGGFYDSGYIQPLDFFGDGPRVPLIVVSIFSRGGHIDHTYTDHASLLKFIEKNWFLPPLSGRSRDNLPNPISNNMTPYVPVNSPAIGDLTEIFHFNPLEQNRWVKKGKKNG